VVTALALAGAFGVTVGSLGGWVWTKVRIERREAQRMRERMRRAEPPVLGDLPRHRRVPVAVRRRGWRAQRAAQRGSYRGLP
jgi:hypothetical protein